MFGAGGCPAQAHRTTFYVQHTNLVQASQRYYGELGEIAFDENASMASPQLEFSKGGTFFFWSQICPQHPDQDERRIRAWYRVGNNKTPSFQVAIDQARCVIIDVLHVLSIGSIIRTSAPGDLCTTAGIVLIEETMASSQCSSAPVLHYSVFKNLFKSYLTVSIFSATCSLALLQAIGGCQKNGRRRR